VAALDRALEGIAAGSPGLVVVTGEAGIGKTRLLRELRDRADPQGFLVLAGRGSRLEAELPFAPVVDALDDYVRSLPERDLAALGEAQLAELGQVLPSLDAGGLPAGLQDERYRAHRAVRALLELLAARQPVLIALDDMHWADEASAELISNLVRRPAQGPVGLAIAYRPGRLPTALDDGLRRQEEDLARLDLDLEPLDAPAVAELIGDRGDGMDTEELRRLSGGNPFYLEELVRAGGESTRANTAQSALAGVRVPDGIAAALLAELDALPEDARRVAEGAAVAGETFSPELAARAVDVPEARALEAIDELLDRDVVRRTDAPRRFRFRHPIVHGAVYESVGAAWRLAAHGRVAAALEEANASPLARAPHVECSAQPGDRPAIDLLSRAGQAAGLRAPAASAHWYGAALRLLPEDETGERLGLMIAMAQGQGYAGRLEAARTTLDEVLFLLRPNQHAVRGQVVAAAARLDQLLGRHAQAMDLLHKALARLPDQTGPEATELKVQLAGACFFSGDFAGLRRWVSEARSEAAGRGDLATRAAATGSLGAAEYMTGDLGAARARLDEAESLMEDLDDQELARRLHSLVWHAMTEVYLERFDRAEALFERGISVARMTGHGHVTTLNRIGEALVLLWRGRIADGDRLLDAAAEAAMLTRNDQFLAWALWARCWAATLGGDLAAAIRHGERSLDSAGDEPDPLSAIAACYLAQARLENGDDPGACRRLLLEGVGGRDIPLVERAFRPHIHEVLTRIELAAGNTAAAGRWAEQAAACAAGTGLHGRSSEAARAAAGVALASGNGAGAATHAGAAVEHAAAAGLPIDEARARILLARALAETDRDDAIRELELARESLDSMGASRYRDEAAAELRRLGRRVARPKRSSADMGEGVAALSPREVEVAGLVAEGRTNKQIAAELFLSEKTIEKHIARIFDKLDVSARAQVAAAIEREREPA
jgi:DNA-binding CsgD family transcriptional regulator